MKCLQTNKQRLWQKLTIPDKFCQGTFGIRGKIMQIEIDRKNTIPKCKNEAGKTCLHNDEVCACNVYAGDEKLTNKFEAK